MQFSNALIALVAAGLASSQGIPDVPSCSLNCFTTALTTDGCSGLTDWACHCGKPELVDQVTPCVEKACPVADQSSVSDVVVSVCSEAGVPIEVPQPGGGEEPTETAPTEPEPTEPAPTEPEPTEPAPTGEPTQPTYPTESSSTPPGSSSATPSSSAPTTPTSSPSPPVFTGAASNVQGNIGGVAALAMAAAYYL